MNKLHNNAKSKYALLWYQDCAEASLDAVSSTVESNGYCMVLHVYMDSKAWGWNSWNSSVKQSCALIPRGNALDQRSAVRAGSDDGKS